MAFWSFASNLVEDDDRGCGEKPFVYSCADIFVRDLPAKTTWRIEVGRPRGFPAGGDELSFSSDGHWLAFEGWIIDLVTGEREPVCGELNPSLCSGIGPHLSDDGRWVVFVSYDTLIIPGDTNQAFDVILRDRLTGEIHLVSKPGKGGQGDANSGYLQHFEGYSGFVKISPNGRRVVFTSWSSNLVPDDTSQCENLLKGELQNCPDVFVYDHQTEELRMVSVNRRSSQGDRGACGASISANGRWTVFTSSSANLTDEGPNRCIIDSTYYCTDVYLHDISNTMTYRVSLGRDGSLGNGNSIEGVISADGQYVAFASDASNLVHNDLNGYSDVFVRGLSNITKAANPGQ